MGASARLSRADISVEPGAVATFEVSVTNTGRLVDQFVLEPLGEAAGFFRAEPPSLSLLPGASGTSVISIAPPRSSAVAPMLAPFAIRVLSHEDPAGSAVEEGRLEIGRFFDATAELVPRTAGARGRRYGKYQMAYDNRGNSRVTLDIVPVDPDQKLDFDIPPSLVVEPGEAAFVKLKVRGRERFFRGTPVSHQFQVVGSGSSEPIPVAGTLLQNAVFPRWLPKAVIGVLVVAALLTGAWLKLVKPVVKDTATTAANAAGNNAMKQVMAAKMAAASAQKQAASAAMSASQAAAPSKTKPGTKTTATPTAVPTSASGQLTSLGDPEFMRLAATSADQSPSVTFPAKQDFSLTDIVIENPNGDTGLMTLMRNNTILLKMNLANFRDTDLHYISPWEFGPGDTMVMNVSCKQAGAGGSCSPSISVNGFTRPVPKATPSPLAGP